MVEEKGKPPSGGAAGTGAEEELLQLVPVHQAAFGDGLQDVEVTARYE